MTPPEHTGECKEIFALLSDYLNLDLPPDACRMIDSHLAGCPPCIEFVESLRKTIALCHGYRPGELPGPIAGEARQKLLEAYRTALGRKID